MARSQQTQLFKKHKSAYGGTLRTKRKGRLSERPLSTKHSMHMVLRSTKAVKEWSFKKPTNEKKITAIIKRFSVKYGVKVISMANVGNHLHLHIQLSSRYTFRPFIKAVTGRIAMVVTGVNRWTKQSGAKPLRFWDHRPFTRFVQSFTAYLNMQDYIEVNKLEGVGAPRERAEYLVKGTRFFDFSTA